MTKKHFIKLAKMAANLPIPKKFKGIVAAELVRVLSEDNPRFDPEIFLIFLNTCNKS